MVGKDESTEKQAVSLSFLETTTMVFAGKREEFPGKTQTEKLVSCGELGVHRSARVKKKINERLG